MRDNLRANRSRWAGRPGGWASCCSWCSRPRRPWPRSGWSHWAFLIHLTDGGRDVQRQAAAALAGAADTLLTPLDPAEREQLNSLLATVAAYWQQVSAGQPEPGA